MKIIIIDDDPTGSQTVNNCLLLLKWDYETLFKGLKNKSNLLFILANTRALSANNAQLRLEEICLSLKYALDYLGFNKKEYIIISRGDSTLRGHNFLEPYIINKLLGPFDATFHIPAFIEGNRITINGKHFVNNIPADETIFAKDEIFGFKTNDIKELLYQKSNQKLNLNKIQNLNLNDLEILETDKKNKVYKFIEGLKENSHVIVDSINYSYLDKFSSVIKQLSKNKRFLFRTAASFINSISEINNKKKEDLYYSQLRIKNIKNKFLSGLIVVGSSVNLTTLQLNKILKIKIFKSIKLDVANFYTIYKSGDNFNQIKSLKKSIIHSIRLNLKQEYIPVLFTSREIISFDDKNEALSFHNYLSLFIAEIVSELKFEIGYLISKGGLTSNTILSKGFNVNFVYLEGQILPGISLVTLSIQDYIKRFPIVTFPGNIGDETSLLKVLEVIENKNF